MDQRTKCTGLRPYLWPSKFMTQSFSGYVKQEEISYI